ncbi:MAG: arylesterase [Deltaproteobacteria bacterium]|nr:arylesterase [Deltaproteobacteria bacterium]
MRKIIIPILVVIVLLVGYKLFFSPSAVRNSTPTGENIICFGDSLTFGTGATENMDYPSQLSRMISKPIINAGDPGDTTAMAMARLEEDVLTQSPRIVLITLGGNDLKNRISKENAYQNLKNIIVSIQDRGALVIVGGISIPFWGRGFGEMYQKVCKETQALLIPNIFDGIIGDKSLMSDSIHPNDMGYTLMAKKFYRAMKPYL